MPYLGKTETTSTLLQNIKTRIFCGFISLNILYFWNASEVGITTATLSFRPSTAHLSKIPSMIVQINSFVKFSD
jgi:hypothetical protein